MAGMAEGTGCESTPFPDHADRAVPIGPPLCSQVIETARLLENPSLTEPGRRFCGRGIASEL